MKRNYTIRDIAAITGFSFKTVSRVINDEPNVKPSTKEKIMQAIAETNYKPNVYARSLNGKTLRNVLVSIRKKQGQNTTQWFDYFMSHLIGASHRFKFTIIQEVIYDDDDLQRSILEQAGGYIDAVALFYLEENDKRIEQARKNGVPFVSFEKNRNVPVSVSNDNRKGMLDAANYLFDRGITRICLLLGAAIDVNVERADALADAYRQRNVALDRLEVVYDMNNLERIRRFVEGRIDDGAIPEAYFVSGDEKAIAVYSAAYGRGLSIPDDVSVIGFDNIPVSAYYYPPLTTMGQNFERLANEMLTVIDRMIEGDDGAAQCVTVEPELIVRSSVK